MEAKRLKTDLRSKTKAQSLLKQRVYEQVLTLDAVVGGKDESFRYWLHRRIDGMMLRYPKKMMLFVMLNPSTADAEYDDPTIRRCKGFAEAAGYGRMGVVNLIARRATKPLELQLAYRPFSDIMNEDYIEAALDVVSVETGGTVVCAWGDYHPRTPMLAKVYYDRIRKLKELADARRLVLKRLQATRDGWPAHPLYLQNGLEPRPWDEYISVASCLQPPRRG